MRRSLLLLALPLAQALAGCHAAPPEHFVVFFSPWSAELDAPAKQVVATVADRARQRPGAVVTVSGFANASVGTVEQNKDIAFKRTQVVLDALTAAGIDNARIRRHAVGGIDGTIDPIEARRVEITLGAE
jgi:outer membrane protein OmpA-like peptidoglycan-associated protein